MPYKTHRFWITATALVFLSACSGEKTADEYLESASVHLESGDISAALIETRNAVRLAPNSATARALLGELELTAGNPVAAETELMKATELGIPAEDLAYEFAQSYFSIGKYDELQAIDVSDLENSERAHILGYQSEAALRQGKLERSRILVAEGLATDPVSASVLTIAARLQLLESNIPSARTYLSTALDNTAGYSPAWELLGDLESSENRLPEAVQAYSRAIETAGNVASPLFKRTRIHLAMNDLASAAQGVEIFEQGNAQAPGISLLKAEIQLREGKLAEAQISLEDGLRNAPDYQPVIRTLAVTHMLRGSLGQAEQFGKQYADTTDSDDARTLLAAIRLQADRLELAEKTLLPLTESGRLSALGAQVLATSQLKQGKLDESVNTMLRLHADLTLAGINEPIPLAMKTDPASTMKAGLVGSDPAAQGEPESQPYLSDNERLLIDAVEALSRKDTSSARDATDKLIAAQPDEADLHTLMARIHIAIDEREAATEALETAIALGKEPGTADILLSILKADAGRTQAAINLLEEAIRRVQGTTRERLLIALAKIEAAIGQNDSALQRLKEARAANPASYQSSLALASYYANASRPELVLESLSGLSTTSLQNPGVTELRVQANISLEQFDKAIDLASPMVQSEPDNVRWRYLRAKAYAGKGDLDAVNTDLDIGLRIDPNHTPLALAKANVSILTNDLQQAEMQLTQLQSLIPGTDALNQLSVRFDTATQNRTVNVDTQASEGSSNQKNDVLNNAKNLWDKGEQKQAMDSLVSFLDTNPDNVVVRLTLANTYIQVNRTEDAKGQFQAVLDVDADNFIALNNLAWYLRDSDPVTAIKHAKRAVEIQPENMATLDTLAVIQFEQGMLTEAGSTFEKIRALQPTDPSMLFHGAQILAALDKKQEARDILAPLVNAATPFPESEAARALYNDLR